MGMPNWQMWGDGSFHGTGITVSGSAIKFSGIVSGATTQIGIDSYGNVKMYSSSQRYKTSIQDYTKGLSEVLNLRPISFFQKDEDGEPTGRIQSGFIAEEIYAAGMEEFVGFDAEDLPRSLNYGSMVSLLTNAIKELNAKIEALEAKVG